ncbi:cation/H(+) antiporter 19-like [Magnolia sinica]|uniref:cation/H(+) antiporter 19-like n=1 Tax=Magnolia sinica TaxID=86752 RepID=UPI00265A7C76|nr:cation/H(+) antiporter 19-like [Magnolia sinica]
MATNNVCPPPMKATSNGSWQGDNPLDYALPLAILQICLVVALTRVLAFLLRPLRQPRVIAEIIGGILLGPSVVGRSKRFLHNVFPSRSLTVLDTLANIGLLFFLFLVGLELDIRAIKRTGKKAFGIAIAGIVLPFIMGIGTSVVLSSTINKGVRHAPFLVFMGVSLSITAFPVLARILAELKLLTTDLGRMAMSAAAVNDVAAWILLALAIALSSTDSSPLIAVWVLLSGAAFICFAVFTIRPILAMMARQSPHGEPVKEIFVCITLSIVLAAGFVTDIIGIHALFGAFIVGLVVPKDGPFSGVLIEKVEDLVSGLLLPLYFVSSGLKTDISTIRGGQSWGLLVLVIGTACIGKIGGTMVVSLIFKMPLNESAALGFLMNTKGLVELIVLNIGRDKHVLNDQTFAILVLMALFTTFMTTPLVTAVYKPARGIPPYKHRMIQRNNWDTELRILACFHSTRNIPTMINIIESSRGTRSRGITVYAMHLMEISERSSTISMVHKARHNGLPFWNKKRSHNDHIVVAFEAYQQLSSVSIRPMTAISNFSTIHEDICTSARQKRAALILLPFHKNQRIDGIMESLGYAFQHINQMVLQHSPCSVGILVDRGLGGATQVSASALSFSAVVLFFGGRDDREAVAYGARIAEHPGIMLTVVKFVPPPGQTLMWDNGKNVSIDMDADDKKADEEGIAEYKSRSYTAGKGSMLYEEKEVGSQDEIIAAVKEMSRCNIFLVGQMPPTAPLTTRSDCPELGPVGSFLASSEFSTMASVLVIKQYNPAADVSLIAGEMVEIHDLPDTPRNSES